MRNEIYEKISQSRKRYLSELNQENRQNEILREKSSEGIGKAKSIIEPESTSVQLGEWVKSKNIKLEIKNRFANNLNKIPIKGIKGKLYKLSNRIQHKLKRANQKLTSRSDGFMEGFVSYSNRIFEDRYEGTDNGNPIVNALVLPTNSSRQIVWEFTETTSNQYLLPPFSESQLGYYLKKAKDTFIRIWKNFRFSIEFEGASLEYEDEVRNISLSEEGRHIVFMQTCEKKDTIPIVPMTTDNEKKDNTTIDKPEGTIIRFLERTKMFFREQIINSFYIRIKKADFPIMDNFIGFVRKLPFIKKALQHRHRVVKHKPLI